MIVCVGEHFVTLFAHTGGSLTHAPKALWSNSGAVSSAGVKQHGSCVCQHHSFGLGRRSKRAAREKAWLRSLWCGFLRGVWSKYSFHGTEMVFLGHNGREDALQIVQKKEKEQSFSFVEV